MHSLVNLLIGFAGTAVVVLLIIFLFNKFTTGGVAALGKGGITPQGPPA